MEIPDLVRQALGDEEIRSGVSLGDEDAACFTPTRTLVYRGEGLLSDEDVAEYAHDFERLAVSTGRRKTKFTMDYVDGQETLSVPSDRTEPILERLLEGTLRVRGVLDPDESVEGVFQFSELTLVVAGRRLVEHIGEYTWDEDFETFPFEDVTHLSFEDGSVATAVVLEVDGRPERIKAPNEEAPKVRRTLQEALFDYHGVGSLEELNRAVRPEEPDDEDATDEADPSGGLGLEADIDPLVGEGGGSDQARQQDVLGAGEGEPGASDGRNVAETDRPRDVDSGGSEGGRPDAGRPTDEAGAAGGAAAGREPEDAGGAGSRDAPDSTQTQTQTQTQNQTQTPTPTEAVESAQTVVESGEEGSAGASGPTKEDVKAISEQLTVLTEAVERQNQLVEEQREIIRKLIQELRKGR